MNIKKLVALGASSLLAISMGYAAPSTFKTQLVDDLASNQFASNDANGQNQNVGAMDNNTPTNPGAAPADANTPNASGDMGSANPGSDEETQDTATGDSDY